MKKIVTDYKKWAAYFKMYKMHKPGRCSSKRGLTFALKSFIQFVLVFFVRRVFQAIFLSFCNFFVISFQKRTNNSFVQETNISGSVQRSPRL